MSSLTAVSFEEYMQAEFEKISEEKFLTMEDGVRLRVLTYESPPETHNGYTFFLFPGWGSVVLGWDEVLMEASKDFNVVYFESVEKGSSILTKRPKTGMDRLSNDVRDVIKQLNLNEDKLILFGSCFGATVISHGLVNNKYKSFFSVLVTPPARFELPPPAILRYLVPVLPAFLFNPAKPLFKLWVRKSKSENPEQAAKYVRVLDEADGRKWKKFGKPIARPWWWDVYKKMDSPSLLFAAEIDKMHDASIVKEISTMMTNYIYVDLGSNKNTHSIPVIKSIREHLPIFEGKKKG